MKIISTIIKLLLITVFGTVITLFGQEKSSVFDVVPEPQRANLEKRLTDFVEFHRTKQWEKVYDFIAEQDKQSSEKGLSKKDFLEKKLYSRVKKFTPSAVQKSPYSNDGWVIWGCAKFNDGGKNQANIVAFFENGDWYFSGILTVFECVGCKPSKCER